MAGGVPGRLKGPLHSVFLSLWKHNIGLWTCIVLWRFMEQQVAQSTIFIFTYFLRIFLIYWVTWLIKLCRFQVCNSIIHHVHSVWCVHHPRSSLLPSAFTRLYPLLPPPPFPLVLTMLLPLYVFSLCLIPSPFSPSPRPPPLWQLSVCFLCLWVCFCFVCSLIVFFRFHI